LIGAKIRELRLIRRIIVFAGLLLETDAAQQVNPNGLHFAYTLAEIN
jgi:hypothetical protein